MFAFHKCASATNAKNVGEEKWGGALQTAINPSRTHPSTSLWLPLSIISVRGRAVPSGIGTPPILFVNILSTSALMRAFTPGACVLLHLWCRNESNSLEARTNQGGYLETHLSRMEHSVRSDLTDACCSFLWKIAHFAIVANMSASVSPFSPHINAVSLPHQ